MKRTHPAFWGAGLAGLFVGGVLAILGVLNANETAQMAGGYGLMLMGAAVYLLGGLGLRAALAKRSITTVSRPASLPRGITSLNQP